MKGNHAFAAHIPAKRRTATLAAEIRQWIRRYYGFMLGSVLLCITLAAAYIYYTPAEYMRESAFSLKYMDSNVFTNQTRRNPFKARPFAEGISMENAEVLLQTPEFVKRVVTSLGLEHSLRQQLQAGKTVDLYSREPVSVLPVGTDAAAGISFRITFDERRENITLDKFNIGGEDIPGAVSNVRLGETVKTPAGTFQFYPTALTSSYSGQPVIYAYIPAKDVAFKICKRLSVKRIDNFTDVLQCSYRDEVVQRADDVLNEIPLAFDRLWKEWNRDDAEKTAATVAERLAVHSRDLAELESEISGFLAGSQILGISPEARKITKQITAYSEQLFQIESDLNSARSIISQIEADTQNRLPIAAALPATERAVMQSVSLYNGQILLHEQAVRNGGANNPTAIAAEKELATLRPAVISAVNNYIRTLEIERQGLDGKIAQANRIISRLASDENRLKDLERRLSIVQSRYIRLKNMQEADLMAINNISDAIRIIRPADGSDNPASATPSLILLLAVLIGTIGLPATGFMLSQLLDTQIKGREDIERLTIPFLGEIPQLNKVPFSTKIRIKLQLGYISLTPPDIVIAPDKTDKINDVFRQIRTRLDQRLTGHTGTPVILSTSFSPGSGKTFIGTNLAASMALKGRKVLLVDLDIRRATLSQTVNSPRKGAVTFLAHPDTPTDSLIVAGRLAPDLDILPTGTLPPNPAELLASKNLETLFNRLAGRYDCIFVDCAPINLVTDTSIIARIATHTLFITRVGLTDRRMLPILEEIARSEEYPKLSIILNGTAK